MERVKYSVVIPTYNRQKQLLTAINSILTQIEKSVEVVVVDDGSNDDTAALVADVIKQDPRVKYYYQENAGASSARNYGVSRAQGRYICFLDSDDVYLSNRLSASEPYLEELDSGTILYSQVLMNNGRSEIRKPHRSILPGECIYDYLFVSDGFCPTPTLVLSRDAAINILWNESIGYGDDTDYVIAATQKGYRLKMLEMALVRCDNTASEGRLSLTKDFSGSLEWYNDNRESMSKSARQNFLVKHLSFAGFYKAPIYFIKVYFSALRDGSINPAHALKYFLRAVLPLKVYHFLRAIK